MKEIYLETIKKIMRNSLDGTAPRLTALSIGNKL